MSRIYILVEGQTEEAFLNEVMVKPYATRGVYLIPIIVSTSPHQSGGMSTYHKVKPQIERQCKQDRRAFVSTLFDYYALPRDFPGYAMLGSLNAANAAAKVAYLERQLREAIDQENFIPNLMLHEFEALLLTDVEAFAEWTDDDTSLKSLRRARQNTAPEDINDGAETAPSKRILRALPGYQKTFHGPLIAAAIGLDKMRSACPHFDSWLKQLERLDTHSP
jgi:Domain of unknown function (DUF4276)